MQSQTPMQDAHCLDCLFGEGMWLSPRAWDRGEGRPRSCWQLRVSAGHSPSGGQPSLLQGDVGGRLCVYHGGWCRLVFFFNKRKGNWQNKHEVKKNSLTRKNGIVSLINPAQKGMSKNIVTTTVQVDKYGRHKPNITLVTWKCIFWSLVVNNKESLIRKKQNSKFKLFMRNTGGTK